MSEQEKLNEFEIVELDSGDLENVNGGSCSGCQADPDAPPSGPPFDRSGGGCSTCSAGCEG